MAYQASWFHGAHFPHLNHRCITAKQLKTKKRFFCYRFSIWAVATIELMWHQVELMAQSLLCCDVFKENKQAAIPGKESSDLESPKWQSGFSHQN